MITTKTTGKTTLKTQSIKSRN